MHIFKYLMLSVAFMVSSSYLPVSDEERNQVLLDLIMQGVSAQHFNTIKVDDQFSEKVFDLYVKRIDYNKRFLTSSDVVKLNGFKTQIDDQVNTKSYEFFDVSLKILLDRINESQSYYQEILEEPFDFEKNETIQLDAEKLDFASDKMELKARWYKSLKYQVMTRIANMEDIQTSAEEKDTTVEEMTFVEMEEKARGKVLKSHNDWYHRMEKLDRDDRLAVYINAIMNAIDPHTAYFPPKDKENFDIAMSGRLEGIGATLQQRNEYIKVQRIVPGSACWKQGELEAGDLILKVAQGADDPVDVVDMRLDEAVKLIRGKKGTEVRLTAKKLDGEVKVIPIIRDVVILDETYAKSALINNSASSANIGYIKLPKFYADFNKKDGRSCSKDVAIEVEKLKTENVGGIILDLRNNGGGSLQDVVDMVGLFIEDGPVVQVKGRVAAPYILSDKDSRVQYDGPLVVMVNSFSASASEILAAAIQDYDRGIIIGSNSTYGKGTVQRFFNLDQFVGSSLDHLKPLGSVKMTTQKFFRVNGGATQLEGVEPDIVLPDNYKYMDIGEKELEYPMSWSEIASVTYDPWAALTNEVRSVKQSSTRVKSNATFQLVEQNAKRMKQQQDESVKPLNYTQFHKEKKNRKAEAKKYEDIKKEIEGFSVTALEEMPMVSKEDSSRNERIKAWHENVVKDAYLNEAMNVIRDLK